MTDPTKKIRVLECIRQGKVGGGESHLLNLVENLDKQHFEPYVLSFTDGPMLRQIEAMGIPAQVIYTERPFDLRRWGSVRQLLKDWQIDLVHAHGTRAASNVIWAAQKLDIPVIYTIHGWSVHPDQPPLVQKMRTLGEQFITRRTVQNISVSKANQRLGQRLIRGFSSVLVNYGIDQQKFSLQADLRDVRKELGIGADQTVVLFIARFTKQKQPLAMVEAFSQACRQIDRLHLLMVGDGELRPDVLKRIQELNLSDRVTLQSFRSDVPDVLAAADIYVLPSLWEGLPIGLLEAMAMERAIIATDVDGTGEVLKDHQNGLLIQTRDLVKNLITALLEMGRDPQLRSSLQVQARKTIEEEFNVVKMTHRIENIYRDALSKPNTPPHGI